jgi:hypothetical protein
LSLEPRFIGQARGAIDAGQWVRPKRVQNFSGALAALVARQVISENDCMDRGIFRNRTNSAKVDWALVVACLASWVGLTSVAHAIDLNGAWATDSSVCNKVFVRKGDAISFAAESDQFGGGVIFEGNKIRGQMGNCTIKARKEDGSTIHFIAACASDIMAQNVQFSAKIINDNTIARIFPGMGDELNMNYTRCRN